MKLIHLIATKRVRHIGVINPGTTLNQQFWIEQARSEGYHTSRSMEGFILLYRA